MQKQPVTTTLITLSLFLVLFISEISATYATAPIVGFDMSLSLSGRGYVEVPDLNPTERFTIEAWAIVAGGKGKRDVVASEAGGDGYKIQVLDSEQWAFGVGQLGNQWSEIKGSEIVLNEWTHLAGTYDGTDIRFYVNGILQGTQVATFDPNDDSIMAPFRIGLFFNGQIDEVRVWNTARSQAQIQAQMYKTLLSNETGLVASYSFNKTTGTTIFNANRVPFDIFRMIQNTPINGTLFGHDADGDLLTYHRVSEPSKGTVELTNANTGAFTYTPNSGEIGTDTFTYKVNDGTQDSNIKTVTLKIFHNTLIFLSDTPIQQAEVGQHYHFTPTTNKVADHALTFSMTGQPVWATFDSKTGTLTGTPTSDDAGTYHPIEISVTDGVETTSLTFNLMVGNIRPAVVGFDKALYFDGTIERLLVNHSGAMTLPTTFSISAWVFFAEGRNLKRPFMSCGERNRSWGFNIDPTLGFEFETRDINDFVYLIKQSGDNLLNQWNHVVVTYDDQYLRLYVNGLLDNTVIATAISLNCPENLQIGGTRGVHTDYHGMIDEVGIWEKTLSPANIWDLMFSTWQGHEDGLMAYWSFNDGTGNLAYDQIGNHHAELHYMDETSWVNFNSFQTVMNTAITDNLLKGKLFALDVNGDSLTYRLVSQGNKGIVTLTDASTGTFTYIPNAWESGVDTFSYQVNDGTLDSEIATVIININPPILRLIDDGRQKLSLPGATSLNVSVSGETLINFVEIFDADNNPLVPPQKFIGQIEENFSVAGDTLLISVVSTYIFSYQDITVTLEPKPLLSNVNKISDKDSVATFSAADFGEHLSDPTGNGLSRVKITSLPTHGLLKLNDRAVSENQEIEAGALKQLTYTPDSNYIGFDSFNWNGSNGREYAQIEAQVSLLIQPFVTLNGQTIDLASAILKANDLPQSEPHKIRLSADITLVRRLPVIDSDIEFVGNGYTISGDNQHQILFVNRGKVSLSQLTLRDGLAQGGQGGQGASTDNPTDGVIDGSGAGGGGGGGAGLGGALFINKNGQVTVDNVTFLNNKATGGFGGQGGGFESGSGQDGDNGFNRHAQVDFGSGGGGGSSTVGVGGFAGGISFADDNQLGQGGSNSFDFSHYNGYSGDSMETIGIGGGGSASVSQGEYGVGGSGGFGGGGGGGGSYYVDSHKPSVGGTSLQLGGTGGVGGTDGADGGGGAGLGGAIFVSTGGVLSLRNTHFENNVAIGGESGLNSGNGESGQAGQGKGGAIFSQDGATIVLNDAPTLSNNSAANAGTSRTDNANLYGVLTQGVSVTTATTPAEQDEFVATFIFSRGTAWDEYTAILFTISGTATFEADYTVSGAAHFDGTTGIVLIPAGSDKSVTLTITPVDDEIVDPNETISIVLAEGDGYQINDASQSAVLIITDNDFEQAFTGVYLETGSSTILNDDKLNIAGKLSRFPEQAGEDLSGIKVFLTITAPDGTQETLSETTRTDTGQFAFGEVSLVELFTPMQDGVFGFQVHFAGTDNLAVSESKQEAVLVGASAGYAIVIQGKIANEEGLASHNKTLKRVYNRLLERGLEALNIHYFNYDTTQDGVDAIPTKEAIVAAFTDIQGRMNSNPAPLYIIMVDHGSRDGSFHIYNGPVEDNNDVIKPVELAGVLEQLEAGLGSHALQKPRIVMIGACFSGSYIPVLSKVGRIIITSATEAEESFKGLQEPDGIRSGEYFMEEFFKRLGQGESLKEAFEFAANKTEQYTRRGGVFVNTANRFLDDAFQHPLLDDNGDGMGSNALSSGGDGTLAREILLGAGLDYDTNAPTNPAEIVRVNPTVYLAANETTARLTINVNNANRINAAPVDIRLPSVRLRGSGITSNTEQLEINNLPRVFMDCTQTTHTCTTVFDQFTEAGKYEAYYFVRDNESNDISPVRRSVIYKNYADNQPPNVFKLKFPNAEGQTAAGTQPKTTLLFAWEKTKDFDGPVTYNLLVATDTEFSNVVYQPEELTTATAYIDETVGLADQTTYYWKVEAVDPYGAKTTSSAVHSFTTDNTNAPLSVVSLYVFSDVTFKPLLDAKLAFFQADDIGEKIVLEPEIHQNQGRYQILLPQGRYRTVLSSKGFQDQPVILEPNSKGAVTLNVMMELAGLGKGMAIDGKGHPVETNAVETNAIFAGTVNGQQYQSPITLSNTDSVAISGEITVDSNHIGQTADILIVLGYTPANATEQFFMRSADGQIQPWDGQINSLVPASQGVMLEKIQKVDIYNGSAVAGQLKVFFGYRLKNGTIVFNGRQGINLVSQ